MYNETVHIMKLVTVRDIYPCILMAQVRHLEK
jgi:hypothetical protein